MSCQEQQEEEREVLLSIYEGDENFIQSSDTKFQYKICDEKNTKKSFLIEVEWMGTYPDEAPNINMDIFFNEHICSQAKEEIQAKILEEAEANLGMAMTYTLFEYAKENAADLMANQTSAEVAKRQLASAAPVQEVATKKKQQDVLSKNQKRRMYDKFGTKGMNENKPRGWDWVDVMKHLAQTGGKD